jgi:hypothetical protein
VQKHQLVTGSINLDQPGTGRRSVEPPCLLDRHVAVGGAVHDNQRRA